ncbi:related to SCT1 - glycerol 3-phosphate/dihydroxyacetone phosphate dual substrate acyltransferase [Melanopsichium pennsylvanicum]|uniref:Related to SCT1 - glycerol 3-phosphate/dihydroxyacetone phosphate dual substrate acyltransferase n=2 Tax=Melanopsichium pennsylvanicum TaxID=63383 RepID=A0AAJ4XMB4_9BASI|nr:related to SCT1-glycerol 3-phosphate/dihydroxyacetone phosphate dual substrate acyltransferase [Melanopsichium pennsylvanicum 4]SNX84850.1 related to SCT1 - glycerol 3-phosphate/dihydroxyacetone phosphate dual substrate acyltransferase [Melanopsichium pennsylvanicum]
MSGSSDTTPAVSRDPAPNPTFKPLSASHPTSLRPPVIDTNPSHLSRNDFPKKHHNTAIAEGTAAEQGSKQKERQRRDKAKHLSLSTIKPVPYSRQGDSPSFQAVLRDFDRLLRSLPIPIHRLVPAIVARLICRVFQYQNIMASNIAFDIALFFWRIIINLFFREIRPRSAWRVPREGPVIFVAAPHHNQFLDPLLLASEVRRASGRRVAFLIAEKSVKRRFIGAAARIMQSIPVARAADSAKPGRGFISLHPSGDTLLLQGYETAFKSQLQPKGQIMLPKACGHATAEVVEVISDTEVKIKKEFKDPRALDMLLGKIPQPDTSKSEKKGAKPSGSRAMEKVQADLSEGKACKYSCLPFVDQTQMYAKVYEKLAEGGCLGIFPEGGSHDRTDLLPLKAGVVIMALGAMSANKDLNVRIVPVGLSYFHPHKFRSRAVVEFGSPIDVPRELVGLFDEGGEGKRKAVGEMMDIVYDGLKGVTLRAPDYETLMVIQAGRRLYRAPGQSLSLGQTVELNRKFIMGYLQFKDEPRVVKLRDEILRYNKKLRYAGLRDHQVERATRAGWRSLGLLAYRLGLLGLWGGLALPGAVLNSPIIVLAKIISHKKAKEALAASQVKVEGRDVLATWKVLVSLGFAPILYSFYAALATYFAHKLEFSPRTRALMPLYTLVVLPTMSYSALKFAEVGIDIYKSLPPLFVSLIPGNHKVILGLQQTRAKISADMHALIDELAPQVWEDFAENSMLPNAAAPPPPQRDALVWKQKKSTSRAGNDALTHPLQWMDERLFGWGKRRRSSTRRVMTAEEIKSLRSASVAAGDSGNAIDEADEQEEREQQEEQDDGERSWGDVSEGSSFTESGEEDEGDYEAVFSMLNPTNLVNGIRSGGGVLSPGTPGSGGTGGRRSRTHSRSRSGSRGSVGGTGETFAEKRNRSNQDLRALMREGGAMSPTATRSQGILDGANSTPVSNSSRAVATRTSALPASFTNIDSTTTAANSNTNSGGGGGGATARRNRTHSLSEDVHVQELKNAGPAARKLPFTAASQAFEVQHEQLQADYGVGNKPGVLPRLEDMMSAENTPPATPAHDAYSK